jgi:DNA-binding response OmpR family regulator
MLYPLSYEGGKGNPSPVPTRPPRRSYSVQMPTGTVLVVDDDPVIVNLLQVNFEIEGYDVLAATGGEAGLAQARNGHPDVIVLDVMMPGIDGLEVARRLRSDSDTREIPIILLSAKAQNSDIQAGLAVADEYITKPFEPLELLERVATVIARRQAAADSPPIGPSGNAS